MKIPAASAGIFVEINTGNDHKKYIVIKPFNKNIVHLKTGQIKRIKYLSHTNTC